MWAPILQPGGEVLMATQNEIDALELVLQQTGERYLAGFPQINLYASAPTREEAIEELERKKRELIAELSAAGVLGRLKIEQPPSEAYQSPFWNGVKYTGKVVAIVIAVIIAGNFVARGIANQIRIVLASSVDRLGQTSGTRALTTVEEAINRAADSKNDLSDERKRVLLSNVTVLVQRWRPFVKEFQLLFADPVSNQPTPSTPNSAVSR
jgi:hypothetical protein